MSNFILIVMGSGGGYLVEFSPGLEEEYTGYLEVFDFYQQNVLWIGSISTFSNCYGKHIYLSFLVSFCILSEGAGGRGTGGRVADWQHKD